MVVPAETRRMFDCVPLDPLNSNFILENRCFRATTDGTLENRVGEPLVRLQRDYVNYQPNNDVSSLLSKVANWFVHSVRPPQNTQSLLTNVPNLPLQVPCRSGRLGRQAVAVVSNNKPKQSMHRPDILETL